MGIFHKKAFVVALLCAQVIAPAQFIYYFITVPASVKDFTFFNSVWNFLYVETMIMIFALVTSILAACHEWLENRNLGKENFI